jgi:hypothetical protein
VKSLDDQAEWSRNGDVSVASDGDAEVCIRLGLGIAASRTLGSPDFGSNLISDGKVWQGYNMKLFSESGTNST